MNRKKKEAELLVFALVHVLVAFSRACSVLDCVSQNQYFENGNPLSIWVSSIPKNIHRDPIYFIKPFFHALIFWKKMESS